MKLRGISMEQPARVASRETPEETHRGWLRKKRRDSRGKWVGLLTAATRTLRRVDSSTAFSRSLSLDLFAIVAYGW